MRTRGFAYLLLKGLFHQVLEPTFQAAKPLCPMCMLMKILLIAFSLSSEEFIGYRTFRHGEEVINRYLCS